MVLLALSVPLALDRYRNLGHAFVDGYLVASAGSLVRRRSAVLADAVIGWNLRSTFFQRRLGLVTLVATTAAGAQGYHVLDVGASRGLDLAEAVTPGLLAQFRAPGQPADGLSGAQPPWQDRPVTDPGRQAAVEKTR